MKKLWTVLITFILIYSCASKRMLSSGNSDQERAELLNNHTFVIPTVSIDPFYAYTPKNPVNVGGSHDSEGPVNERRYLNALTGPDGEEVSYFRVGSCCSFKTKNGFKGRGMLDRYKVTWKGTSDTVSIYLNMYDFGQLQAPRGFGVIKKVVTDSISN